MQVVISAGPTRESIDPVRFLSNHSSGKMGYALAEAAYERGWDVTLVSGPVSLKEPQGISVVNVISAADMAREMKTHSQNADLVIMCAAVADYRPANVHNQKMKKTDGNLIIELERTEDILASLGKNKKDCQKLVGFAAETQNLLDNAQEKLERKNLDWIVANKVGKAGQGFAADANEVTMIAKNGEILTLPLANKKEIAEQILVTLYP